MKKLILYIITILLLNSFSFSQSKVNVNNLIKYGDKWFKENQDSPFSGIVFDIDKETGVKILEYIMLEGLKNGKYTKWNKDGDFIVTGFFKSGKQNGEWVYYNQYEHYKESRKTWKDGIVNGLVTYWYPNGNKEQEGNNKNDIYNNRKKYGEWIFYYENGQKKDIKTYINDIENGLATEWLQNGNKRAEGNYKGGEKDGQWVRKNIYYFSSADTSNYLLAKIKELSYSDSKLQGNSNIKTLLRASLKSKFASKKDVIKTVKQLAMAGQMESYIQKTNNLNTGEQFFESLGSDATAPLIKMFNVIKNSNIIVKELSLSNHTTLNDLILNEKLVYLPPIKNYKIISVDKMKKDINSILERTEDEKYKTKLKNSLIEILQLERDFLIIKDLHSDNIIDHQRPLYFLSNENNIKGTYMDMKYSYNKGVIIKSEPIKQN
jgi:antitoxin component YwqK of YwqJK toxin-antitoxin module